jgi:hypothetical protein
MQEELVYFVEALLNKSWSYADEMAWWACEHSENLDFINCELPRLVKLNKIKVMEIPTIVKMLIENKQLSDKFKGITKTITHEGNVNPQVYHDMISAKISHINGIDKLQASVPKLPLSDEDKLIVEELLQHEKEEAEFAFMRLER